ncbi:hypothetical protein EJ06DRAFT_281033 [Trichodelitschia bisporula]|uniref:Uncharacterized protein n=1 Tax=Trichodelitschia bisporula TaxID=703511 RepID=A0A6G1I5F4_9PEZI|nr:hypothetical protein EJ06DRAFT_281033 [Trichodelitschia bisporula]
MATHDAMGPRDPKPTSVYTADDAASSAPEHYEAPALPEAYNAHDPAHYQYTPVAHPNMQWGASPQYTMSPPPQMGPPLFTENKGFVGQDGQYAQLEQPQKGHWSRGWRFWALVALAGAVIIGMSVGGAVGGTMAARKHTVCAAGAAQNQTAAPATSCNGTTDAGAASPSSSTAPTGTVDTSFAVPTQQCGTNYQSRLPWDTKSAKFKFTKYCGRDLTGGIQIAQGFTHGWDDCIEMCASLNVYLPQANITDLNCTGAVYISAWNGTAKYPLSKFPVNCFASTCTTVTGPAHSDVADWTYAALMTK